jgi:hypothetical protein
MSKHLKQKGPSNRIKGTGEIDLDKHRRFLPGVKKLGSCLNAAKIVLNETAFDEGAPLSLGASLLAKTFDKSFPT